MADYEITCFNPANDELLHPNGSDYAMVYNFKHAGSTVSLSSPSSWRSVLGLVIGTDVQAQDGDLDDIAGLTPSDDDFLVRVSSAWANQTPSQVKTLLAITESDIGDLGSYITDITSESIGDLSNVTFTALGDGELLVSSSGNWVNQTPAELNLLTTSDLGSSVAAYDEDLEDIAALTPSNDDFIVRVAGSWANRTAAQVRTTLNVENGADVTDTTNVGAAGALMDSEVSSLSGIKSLTVPDSTTISNFGASLIDDSSAAIARGTLGLDTDDDVEFASVTDSKGALRSVPQDGADKTSSYTLQVSDNGETIGLGTGAAPEIPDATFSGGEIITLENNTSGNITLTCTITTAYIAGTDTNKATVTIGPRGFCTIKFRSGTECKMIGRGLS